MTTKDFIQKLSDRTGKPEEDCIEFMEMFFDIFKSSIYNKKKISFRRFGTFILKDFPPRQMKSFGKEIITSKKRKIIFKPSKKLLEVNDLKDALKIFISDDD